MYSQAILTILCVLQVHSLYIEEQSLHRVRRQFQPFANDFKVFEKNGNGLYTGGSNAGSGNYQAHVGGQVSLLNTPTHNLQGFGMHQRSFNNQLHGVSPNVNSVGLNYNHRSGFNSHVVGSQMAGTPIRNIQAGVSVPVGRSANTRISGQYSNTFGAGSPRQQSFGVGLLHKF